jgi:hypothetical protein
LTVATTCFYSEIFTPGPFQGWPIVSPMQDIRLPLDERGAILKTEAGIEPKNPEEPGPS